MAEAFAPFDLGRTLAVAEQLKGMRRASVMDNLQAQYLQGQIARAPAQEARLAAQESRAAAQEKRVASEWTQDQQLANTRFLNMAAAEVVKNPAAAKRWEPVLKAIDPNFTWGANAQQSAGQIFEATSAALQAFNAGSGATAAKPSALIEQYDRYVEQGGKLPFVDPNGRGQDFITQFSQSQVGAQYGAPVNQPGVGVVQPSRVDPGRNVTLAPESAVSGAAAQRAGAETAAATTSKAVAERQIDLPRLEQNAAQSIKIIDDLKTHPGLPYITGLYSKAPIVPNTDQAAADALAKQIAGSTFLEAYKTLKGGGQITEVEGTKAQEAIGRLSRAQSTEDYIGALDDLRSVLSNGLERARKQAQQAAGSPASENNDPLGIR